MRTFKILAIAFLKDELLDPQGQAVEKVVRDMGLEVENVRIGRAIRFLLKAKDEEQARKLVEQKLSRIVANPVIERYVLYVEEV